MSLLLFLLSGGGYVVEADTGWRRIRDGRGHGMEELNLQLLDSWDD